MGKNVDVAKIILIVIVGMFIPFLGSLVITFNMDLTCTCDLLKIGSTFGWFLLIFGIELVVVYLYYSLSNKLSEKKLEDYRKK